ncbi:MAG: hypothetical protein IM509_05605 [Microcystis sp. M31BS1]|nr:hypothetical protein [Microcystis sp. M31BS1]
MALPSERIQWVIWPWPGQCFALLFGDCQCASNNIGLPREPVTQGHAIITHAHGVTIKNSIKKAKIATVNKASNNII